MFRYKKAGKLQGHIARFFDVTNRLSKAGIILSEKEQIKKPLVSLPQDWSLQCMMIKRDMLTSTSTLADLISNLKGFEMDLCKRGMYDLSLGSPSTTTSNAVFTTPVSAETSQALGAFAGTVPSGSVPVTSAPIVVSQPSGTTTQGCNIASQMLTEHMALFGMFDNNHEALIVGDLKGKKLVN
jgi:hypothetical protein